MGIAAAIAASAEAVKTFFAFLCTTQGQALVAAWIKDAEKFNDILDKAGTWIVSSVKELIPQKHV